MSEQDIETRADDKAPRLIGYQLGIHQSRDTKPQGRDRPSYWYEIFIDQWR